MDEISFKEAADEAGYEACECRNARPRPAARHPLAERVQRERDGVLARRCDPLDRRVVEGVDHPVGASCVGLTHRDDEYAFVATAINLKINS
ncbi:hypothetical protein [Burkholderia cepacia]|uniref:hypothetical protein n=1 Tax=Burkholderia cepacia TaxID=292 RepID=UPI0012D88FF2|nr:hypothetical protein [Burkholderia cepacia]